MTQRKRYIVSFVSTAIFAVLSIAMMLLFKVNEDYFDSHGRLGTLAQTEQQNMILETNKAISYKRNISMLIDDKAQNRLVLPLSANISENEVSVREEFATNKIIITLNNAATLVENDTVLTTDSGIMDAVGLYKQDNNVVIEVFEKIPMGYVIECDDNCLIVEFKKLREMYDYITVIYVPFEKKDRLYSEEWVSQLKEMAGESKKIYLASAMREKYEEGQILDFANEVKADVVIEIDYESTYNPEYMEVTYNDRYYIPELSSADLAVLERTHLEDKTKLNVASYKKANEEDILIYGAKVAAAKTTIYIQTDLEKIEDKYTLNHNVMEGITSIIKELTQE